MPPPVALIPAVLIANAQTTLRLDEDYLIRGNGEDVLGRIHSIHQRLLSPFVTLSSQSLLHPRELAYVEIEAPSPLFPAERSVEKFAIVDSAAGEAVATGLLFPPENKGAGNHAAESCQGLTVWLTGLSGAGKTTIARRVREMLSGSRVELLDADIVRTYLCKDLGYSREDRNENVRRLGFLADLLTRRGTIILITAIAPYREGRAEARRTIGRFLEVYVNAPINVCEQRDVKGLYKRARAGEIRFFTGIDDPYEVPLDPEVECRTDCESVEQSALKVIAAIRQMHAAALSASMRVANRS